ncbi:MAG: A/G-specific adenine glycosylase, partial [Chloroflexi bacterium]|nr:A/G-specific adenine glycosylase [Chloroflexota bacterium]
PYFERFLARFPDVRALAGAEESDVIAHWAGLGYYSRARNLHRAARVIVDQFGAELPGDVNELLRLPGIGRYTAGAIASIAYGNAAPILDGNVMRVLCRLLEIRGDPRTGKTNVRLWGEAAELAAGPDPGALNEALMELGALACIPGTPRCHSCPVSPHCRAFKNGSAASLPERKPDPTPEARLHTALVIRSPDGSGRERFLLRQPVSAKKGTEPAAQRDRRIWAGLWTFPTDFPDAPQQSALNASASARPPGLAVGETSPLVVIRHGVMSWRITLHVFETRLPTEESLIPPDGYSWVDRDELETLPLPAPHRKIAQMLRSENNLTPVPLSASERGA